MAGPKSAVQREYEDVLRDMARSGRRQGEAQVAPDAQAYARVVALGILPQPPDPTDPVVDVLTVATAMGMLDRFFSRLP